MILRSIEIEGFRCFDRLVSVGEFAPGLNVLSGPNGVGKSTLLRALRHVLVDAHSLTGASVKQAMAPWGRALNPRIRVVMEHGGTEWRLEKKFLSGAFARLERQESGVFRPVAEGREAEAAVREMLLAESAPRGLAAESHLGLLQVLWTPQGPPALPDWSTGVRATLQEAFGAALSSRAADQLTELVDKRFGEYFSPTGLVKKSSPVIPLQQEIGKLQEQLRLAEAHWQRAGQNRETLANLQTRIAEGTGRLAALLPALEQARQHQREFAEATTAELRARQVYERLDTQQRLAQKVREEEARHEAVRKELAAAQAFQPQIEQLELELESLHQRGVDAKAWPEWLRLQTLSVECGALRAEISQLRAPAPKSILELRRIHQQLEIKLASLDAASLKVNIEAESDLTVESEGRLLAASTGEVLHIASPQSITFRIPGVVRVTAASANAQAAGFSREIELLRSQLAEILRGESIEEMESRFARSQILQQSLETKLAEIRPLEARRVELEELARRRAEWAEPPDLEAIRGSWKACKEKLDAGRAQFNLAGLSAAEAGARATLAATQAQLRPGPEGVTLEDAQIDLLAARVRLEALKSGGATELASLEPTVQTLQTAIGTDREAAARVEGESAFLQAQNVYTVLAETEERLAERTAALDRQSRRAAAILLLKGALTNAQASLTAALPEQIAGHATRYWRHIAGAEAPAIRIDQAWKPAGLDVPAAAAELHELSGGEAEQVAFATRLALAMQLAQKTRQLAVFDDAFLASDPSRAERILELLTSAADRLQIIVLTCHPARYGNLAAVRHFDLEKLK